MRTIEGFKLRKLGNEYILIGETLALINFNKVITLNETAAFLWQQAEALTVQNGSFTVADLCQSLCAEYDVSPDQAMADVSQTIDEWLHAEVIF